MMMMVVIMMMICCTWHDSLGQKIVFLLSESAPPLEELLSVEDYPLENKRHDAFHVIDILWWLLSRILIFTPILREMIQCFFDICSKWIERCQNHRWDIYKSKQICKVSSVALVSITPFFDRSNRDQHSLITDMCFPVLVAATCYCSCCSW